MTPITPAFAAVYAAIAVSPGATRPRIEATLTIEPLPAASIARPASCASAMTASRLMSIVARSCARSCSSNGTTSAMPAFGTAMSRRPWRVSACCTSRSR